MNEKCRKSFFNSASKGFWNIYKAFFWDKGERTSGEKILLVNNGNIISNDRDVATTFNQHFSNIADSLNILKWNPEFASSTIDPVVRAIEKFATHPSVVTIENRENVTAFFEFRDVSYADVFHEILCLDASKKTSGNISIESLKVSVRKSASTLMNCYRQLKQFIESKLSKFLCGFRKGYSTQYSPVNLIQN